MNDLNTINRLNAERFADPVDSARANGKHVLVYKSGLSVTKIKTFDTAEEVQEATAADGELATGVTRHYLAPTAPSHTLRRDQSEDRVTSADKTLGDYITRKTA